MYLESKSYKFIRVVGVMNEYSYRRIRREKKREHRNKCRVNLKSRKKFLKKEIKTNTNKPVQINLFKNQKCILCSYQTNILFFQTIILPISKTKGEIVN